ncbi:MAG TPA: hypothetical protein VFA56_08080 [Gaiellaceae bacterium]|nr:hypothetical protein [Gaiellaceae bacterium]
MAVAASAGHVCDTWQRAYSAAASGDVIGVRAGTYAATNPGANAMELTTANGGLSSPVTFRCADGESADTVNFAPNAYNFNLRFVKWVTVQGGCFHFRIIHVNSTGDSGVGANNITIDGVHTDSFQFAGAHNLTLRNSTVGPALMCYGNGQGPSAAQRCSNYAAFPSKWQAVAQYWSTTGSGGTVGEQLEPYIHDRGNGSDTNQCSQNVTIQGNTFKDMQSTDSAVNHTGGLLIDGGACQSWSHNLVLERNSFFHNMTYGIEMDGPMSGTIVQNNWIGQGYAALGTGGSLTGGQDTPNGDSFESGCRGGQHRVSDMLIRFNSGDGYFTVNGNGDGAGSGCWSNVRIIGNIFKNSVFGGVSCGGVSTSYTSILYAYNAVVNGTCGTNGVNLAALPFAAGGYPINFALVVAPPLLVPNLGGDYVVGNDFSGAGRSYPTRVGA